MIIYIYIVMLSQLIPRVKDEFGTITVPTIPIKEDSTVRKIVYIYIKLVTTKRLSITENKKRTRSLLLRPTFFYFIFPILLFFFFFFLLTFDRPIASGHASQ
jgi:ACR3 family arsenite efflux pump ArsB